MAPRERPGADPLGHFRLLLDQPTHHHFFHALRVVENAFPDAPRLGQGRRPAQDRMRIGQDPSMAFARTTITRATAPGGNGPGQVRNLFFGLFGPHGPLPAHLTEYARERERTFRDPTFVAFADMLTHRVSCLLYRAWATGQPAVDLDRGDKGRIARKVAALSGHHGATFRNRDAMPDMAKRYFSGHLARGPRTAAGLESMVSAFFRAPVRVQQFVGSWLTLEPDDRWHLGAAVGLGQGTGIGERVWSRSAKFRLRIGPLSLEEYRALLPGGTGLARLAAIVRNYVGDALDYDVNLVLAGADVPTAALNGTMRLGQTGWIGTRAAGRDADDLHLEPLRLKQTPADGPQEGLAP